VSHSDDIILLYVPSRDTQIYVSESVYRNLSIPVIKQRANLRSQLGSTRSPKSAGGQEDRRANVVSLKLPRGVVVRRWMLITHQSLSGTRDQRSPWSKQMKQRRSIKHSSLGSKAQKSIAAEAC
jgi:hypothetical protein